MTETIALALSLGALVSMVAGWLRWGRPRIRKAKADGVAMRDAILGRDAVVDTITGKELASPLPGIGVRMAHQEQQMEAITSAVTRLASQQEALTDHERRIKALEEAAVERVVQRAEGTAMFRAMEAVAKAVPPDEIDQR